MAAPRPHVFLLKTPTSRHEPPQRPSRPDHPPRGLWRRRRAALDAHGDDDSEARSAAGDDALEPPDGWTDREPHGDGHLHSTPDADAGADPDRHGDPDPGTIHGTVGEWIIDERDGGTVSVRLRAYRTRETLPVSTSDEADGELEAPGDATWVETLVSIRSHDSTQTFSYDQRAVEDFQEDRFAPDPEAMDGGRGTTPEEVVRRSGTLEEYAVYFALEHTRDLTFYVEPYGDVGLEHLRLGEDSAGSPPRAWS